MLGRDHTRNFLGEELLEGEEIENDVISTPPRVTPVALELDDWNFYCATIPYRTFLHRTTSFFGRRKRGTQIISGLSRRPLDRLSRQIKM